MSDYIKLMLDNFSLQIIIHTAMNDFQLFPRYGVHQLRTQLSATVVGKLIQINKKKGSIILQTDPETKLNIEVILSQDEDLNNFTPSKFYEIRGRCRSGKQIDMCGYTCFGSDFDLSSYNQMLQLATKQFKSIFYS